MLEKENINYCIFFFILIRCFIIYSFLSVKYSIINSNVQNKCKLLYNCKLLLFGIQFCSIINCVTFDFWQCFISKVGLAIFISVIDVTPDQAALQCRKIKIIMNATFYSSYIAVQFFFSFWNWYTLQNVILNLTNEEKNFVTRCILTYISFSQFFFISFCLFLVKITFKAFATLTCYITLSNSFSPTILFHTKIYPMY